MWIADISRRKEKGKKRKARKGKDDEGKGGKPGDGKGQSNNVQPQTSSTPALQNRQQQAYCSSAASSSGHGFLAFAETDLARVDVLIATYEEQEYKRRTRLEDKTNVMQWHGKSEKKVRGFLFWLEKLEQFNQLYNGDQRLPRAVCRLARLHGSHWRKALFDLCMDTPKTWRYHCSLNTLQNQRKQLGIRVLFLILCHAACS